MGANTTLETLQNFAGFNPRTRDGCEADWVLPSSVQFVSIHAPVMGAKIHAQAVMAATVFQSTHP